MRWKRFRTAGRCIGDCLAGKERRLSRLGNTLNAIRATRMSFGALRQFTADASHELRHRSR